MALTDESGMNTTMLVSPAGGMVNGNGGFGFGGDSWAWIILLLLSDGVTMEMALAEDTEGTLTFLG